MADIILTGPGGKQVTVKPYEVAGYQQQGYTVTGRTSSSPAPNPAPTPTPSPTPAPAPNPTPNPSALLNFGDYAKSLGLTPSWNSTQGAMVNGQAIDLSGLGMQNNQHYGTKAQLDELLSPYVTAPVWNPPVAGEYKDPYADQLKKAAEAYFGTPGYESQYKGLLDSLLLQLFGRGKFNYDPNTDPEFANASKALSQNTLEQVNSRGLVNSTIAENQIQQGISDLIPQFRAQRQQEWIDEGNALMQQANLIMQADEQGYNHWKDTQAKNRDYLDWLNSLSEKEYGIYKDTRDAQYQQYKDQYTAELNKIEQRRAKIQAAWDRVDQLGYADNEAAVILGIKPGTESKLAREARIKRQQELEDQKAEAAQRMAEIDAQYQNQAKLEGLRSSGSAGKNAPIAKKGTPEQVQSYYTLRDIYMGGGSGTYKDNPAAAYQWLSTHAKDNVALIGQQLYDQLLEDVYNAANFDKKFVQEPQPTQTEQTHTNEAMLQTILDNKGSDEERLKWIQDNAENIIGQFGRSYYNSLVKYYESDENPTN